MIKLRIAPQYVPVKVIGMANMKPLYTEPKTCAYVNPIAIWYYVIGKNKLIEII